MSVLIRRKSRLAILLGGLLFACTASAATYDPKLKWRTIVTEHFRIHFHQGEEQLANEFAQKVEQIYEEVSDDLQWKARMKTDVVLVDQTDRANGFATAVPYNSMTIYVTAPQEDSTLSLYEDWFEGIFTHEMTHVLHMETNHGIVRAARFVVGRIASSNIVSPGWMIEGLATFEETRYTAGGRGRAPYVDMIKRASVVDDMFPPLGNMDGYQITPPAGNLRYLFGQDFMQYVSDHAGKNVWTTWTHQYGGHIPYLFPSKKVFGKKLQALYEDWRTSVYARYATQLADVTREGVREGRLLSDANASCTSPTFSPTGEGLVWSCSDLRTGSSIWRADSDGSNAEMLIKDFGARTFTWRSDGKAFAYAANHIVNRFNTWSDLYLYNVEKKQVSALTRGARARDPDFSPDGSRLWMVTNSAQDTSLVVTTVDGQRRVLTEDTDHTQYATPRHAPSGEVLAVSIWRAGRRDLWLMDKSGAPIRRLTDDVANEREPTWSPDGRFLFFVTDRTGIPNVFALDLETEELWQVTNTKTGAGRPSISPDGKQLAYQQYQTRGWQVRLMALNPKQWIDRGSLTAPLDGAPPLASLDTAPRADFYTANWDGAPLKKGPLQHPLGERPHEHAQTSPTIDTFEQANVEDAYGDEEDYPFVIKPKRYSPAHGLLPRYVIPGIALTQRLSTPPTDGLFGAIADWPYPFNIPGLQLSLSTSATDPLRLVAWNAYASYRTDARFFGGGGSLTINKWMPVFTLSASTSAFPRTYQTVEAAAPNPDGSPVLSPVPSNYFERRISGRLLMQYPFTARSTIFGAYEISDRLPISEISDNAYAPSLPLVGTLGRLSAGYRYAWSRPTSAAISTEDGTIFNAVGAVVAPWLGSFSVDDEGNRTPFFQVQLSSEVRGYVVTPWAPNHVFAMRGAIGVAFGGDEFVGNYQLGGNDPDSSLYTRPPEYRMIRGYPFGARIGDTYWLTGLEYRLPLWRIDRGVSTFPLFLRALSAAVFVDAGNAFNEAQEFVNIFTGSLVGVGGELRLSSTLGWSIGYSLRVGYAVGLTPGGFGPSNPRAFYFQLGSSF